MSSQSSDSTPLLTSRQDQESGSDGDQDGPGMDRLPDFLSKLSRSLECPVCLEVSSEITDVVQSAELFLCRTGHTICARCRLTTDQCPTCQSPLTGSRNFGLEESATLVLQETAIKCKNQRFGCNTEVPGKNLPTHLVHCWYEQVPCPAARFGTCNFTGNRLAAFHHAMENGCTEVVNAKFTWIQFTHNGPFGKDHIKLKPVIFAGHSMWCYRLYLLVEREATGDWFLYICSLLHKDLVKDLQYTIEVFAASQPRPDPEDTRRKTLFSFIGSVHEASVPLAEIKASGNFLRLCDSQVMKLANGDKLFNVSISLSVRKIVDGVEGIRQIHPRA